MRRVRLGMTLVLMLAALVSGSAPSGSAASGKSFTLRRGKAVFWNGPMVKDSSTPPPGAEMCGGVPCWNYTLRVVDRGYRLRVGIDHPEVSDVFSVRLTSPEGSVETFSPGTGLYSMETLKLAPEKGLWRIQVTADSVTDSNFRMRAKLEASRPAIGQGKVLPNLQVLPPHDASFLFPATNGTTDPPRGIDVAGAESCHPEEHVEEQAVRCLRFGFGIRNTGLGPMQLYTEGTFPLDATLYQRVQRSNGTYFDRVAGMARYHKTHAHYHHHDAVGLRLFRVNNLKNGDLEPVTPMRYKGFAHRDELLREWRHFYPTWDRFGFGLLAGWSDIYEWDRPGNYIPMGLNGDGHYVIRMWADPVEGVLESNEVDNAGYTFFEVTGDDVELIEAGRGSDPWDRCKILMPFGGHREPRQDPRPKNCPADTT